jgi:hypothetical protein
MPVKFEGGLSEVICHFGKWNPLLAPFSPRASCRWVPRSNRRSRNADELYWEALPLWLHA